MEPLVFIAEDDAMYSHMVHTFIERNGIFKARAFTTGEALLDKMNEQPRIVILDHNLNDKNPECMNGIDVLQHLNTEYPHTPVVVLSGQDEMRMAVDLISSGACDYINKNDQNAFEQLDRTLRDILHISRSKTEFQELKNDMRSAKKRLVIAATFIVAVFAIANLL